MGKIRDAERTRGKILDAAKEEFFAKGYSGAKIESIAKRAGINKQLIYHYFKGKDEIINEVIKEFVFLRAPGNFILPTDPVKIAEYRYNVNINYLMDFLKFTAWEAVDSQLENTNGEEHRKKVLESYVEDMRSKQEMGLVSKELDPAFITLMISSLTIYPLLYGKVTKMITGLEPENPEFQEQWSQFLTQISERIFK